MAGKGKSMSQVIKVTRQGVLVPRLLLAAWGDVREVKVEQRADALIIRPSGAEPSREDILNKMKAAGLIEDLPWAQGQDVSAAERARLAEQLSQGKPLSEVIIEEREEHA